MPQLDVATFYSQLIWVTIFFLLTYALIINLYLPSLTRVYKLREKKLIISNFASKQFTNEIDVITNAVKFFFFIFFGKKNDYSKNLFQTIRDWNTKKYFELHQVSVTKAGDFKSNFQFKGVTNWYADKIITALFEYIENKKVVVLKKLSTK